MVQEVWYIVKLLTAKTVFNIPILTPLIKKRGLSGRACNPHVTCFRQNFNFYVRVLYDVT